MNKYMMGQLADLIENIDPVRFNIEFWTGEVVKVEMPNGEVSICYNGNHYGNYHNLDLYDCKTAGCVAGWAVTMASNMRMVDMDHSDIPAQAALVLGLNDKEASSLFHANSKSVWHRYRKELRIPTADVDSNNCPDDCDLDNEIHYCGYEIKAEEITADIASKVLRMIINEEIILTN